VFLLKSNLEVFCIVTKFKMTVFTYSNRAFTKKSLKSYVMGVFCLLKSRTIHTRAALTSEKREAYSSSHHGDAVGCPLSLYCKFDINLRLYAIWLVAMKNIMSIKPRNSEFRLLCYLRKENPALPHNMVIQLDVHSMCSGSLKLI